MFTFEERQDGYAAYDEAGHLVAQICKFVYDPATKKQKEAKPNEWSIQFTGYNLKLDQLAALVKEIALPK